MLSDIYLHGDLGRQFGRYHCYDLANAEEIFMALGANYPDFRSYLLASIHVGVAYVADWQDDAIHVYQLISGSGGAAKAIAGVALLGVSLFMPFSIGLLGSGVLTSTTIGSGLLLSGVGELLSPGTNTKNANTVINPVGTVFEGDPIPVCYGRVFIPGRAISAGINVTTR